MNRRPQFRFVSLVLGAAAAVGVLGTPATASAAPAADRVAHTQTTRTAVSADEYEARVMHWVNVVRKNHHLKAVRSSGCADRIANHWGRYLASHNEFYHQDLGKLLDRCSATYAGETLAMGAVAPRQIVSMWMHSPDHRAIVLSSNPRRVGVGAGQDSNGAWVVAADFIRH